MRKKKILSAVLSASILVVSTMTPVRNVNAAGNDWVVKSEIPVLQMEKNANNIHTAEGIAIDTDHNNEIYTTQYSEANGCVLLKNGKVVKDAFGDGVASSKVLEHANDITYYDNHLYIAAGKSNKIYRMKRENGTYKYQKVYTMDTSGKAWNITKYKKVTVNGNQRQLFIIGLSGNNTEKLKFQIAYFRDTDNKFVKVRDFTVPNPNGKSYNSDDKANILQGIAYKEDTEYLQICLSSKNAKENKIVAVKMKHTTSGEDYAYTKDNTTIVERTLNLPSIVNGKEVELEGMAVDSEYKYYVYVNIPYTSNKADKHYGRNYDDPVYAVKIQ